MIGGYIQLGTCPPRTDRHRLAGINYRNGVLARGLIVVRDRVTQVLVAAKISDPVTGAWEIYGLPEYPEKSLVVELFDDTGTYNVDAADYVSQVRWGE